MNLRSAANTRSLIFQSKYAAAQDRLLPVVSAFAGVDTLNGETAEQVLSLLGDLNVSGILVTDAQARVLLDSSATWNREGRFALFPEIMQALSGNDAFCCRYGGGVLESRSAMPLTAHGEPIGCVYVTEYDTEQGAIIADLERSTRTSSFLLEGAVILVSVFFAISGSGRMKKILRSVRMAREGEYSQKIRLRGSDELSKLAAEFNKLTERLQTSEKAQRQFISDASHELKTPLASIKLLSDSILQNDMEPAAMREFVADIGSESDRLTRMTQKLLTLSRTEQARQSELEHEVVDMENVIGRVYRMLVPLAAEREIKLTANLAHGCTVLSAEDDIYQILFNLVENAIKYNREHGSVHVKLTQEQEDVTVCIEDTGMGIAEDALEHIFERFYRVDKARSRESGGAGLGLSIVYELVKRNLGTISITSEEGIGSCFTVTFPYFECNEEDVHEDQT